MTTTIPDPGRYEIDSRQSVVDFTSKHRFGLGTVSGRFRVRSGEINVTNPVTASTALAVADATSFTTGHQGRDSKVRSETFLDAASHPDISFASSAIRNVDGRWTVTGILTVRGVQAPVEFTVTQLVSAHHGLTAVATATVDRYAHGLTAMKGMAGRYLRITVTIIARS